MFNLKEKGTTVKNEIIGGVIAFIAMCYILPVNAVILSDMGMNAAGVFAITALLSAGVSIAMGLIANYPIILSAGMGLNAFIAYTLSDSLGFTSWQQKMILLTVMGILFLALSLTPIRKKIIEAIPANLRGIISSALGGFILFVGLKGSGIIVANSTTFVTLGNFLDPAMLISFIGILVTLGLLFVKNKIVSNLAIPIGVASIAIVGIIISSILIANGSLVQGMDGWVYAFGEGHPLTGAASNLPIGPWNDSSITFGLDFNSIGKVFAFGIFGGEYSGEAFVQDLGYIFTKPATYIAIFSLMFVKLFESTATLISVGKQAGFIEENGEFKNYKRVILVDAGGTLVSGPLGTSAVTPFVESNVGISLGGKTGLMAVTGGVLFLLSAFIYPIFSVFTSGAVTAPALVAVGLMIMVNSLKDVQFKDDFAIGITAAVTIVFTILTYSIANGIGFGILAYIITLLVSKRYKEITVPLYIIAGLYLVSFALTAIMTLF